MRYLLARFVLAAGLAAASVARAQSGTDIQALIESQLDAFAHDDAATAYTFAAPAIRERFTDPAAFLEMVKRVYPPVYRHRSAEFSETSRDGDEIHQGVTFVDTDNEVWRALYTLARQADGSWKITGCMLQRSDESSL
jgi:hypothetical protein